MNVIIYDLESMVKFVKSVEQFPILYNTSNPSHHSREKQNECWIEVAKEMGDDITLCRDKWKNVKASYTRYLKRVRNGLHNTKEYYLAPYLHYLTPFITYGGTKRKRPTFDNEKAFPTSPGIDLDYHTDDYVKTKVGTSNESSTSDDMVLSIGNAYFTKTDEQCSSESDVQEKREQEIEDKVQINFFKSLLPEVGRMTKRQKLYFKQTVLQTIEDILYNSSEQTQ